MNFQQLEYVIAVHKHQHFGAAADQCHITQATLSAMIKKLEEELGVLLFDRSRKPVTTTDLGQQFVAVAKEILVKREELIQLGKSTQNLDGELRIGIIPTVANSLLPMILSSFLKEHPNIQLTIAEITTEEIKQQLTMDRIDLGILATPVADEQFNEHILYYESMMVYGELDDSKEYVTSTDVKNSSIWLLEEGHCFSHQAETICEIKEKEMEKKNLKFRGSTFETLLTLTDNFGGYTLIPELYYQGMSKSRKKKTRPFQNPVPVREISIITYRHFAKNRTIEYLTSKIRSLVLPRLSTSEMENKDMEIIDI